MGKVEFLLKSKLESLIVLELEAVKKEYFGLLELNKFPKSPVCQNFSDMIYYFKRKDEKNPISIGPYKNITPFEAANRIASDLVIINGLLQLVKEKKLENVLFTLRLGTTHVKHKGDFTIKIGMEEFEGEAFNVAPSFLKAKLQKTKSKWKEKELSYILINEDAFEGFKGNLDKIVFKVKEWNK
jgi:hypothetical protein